MKTFLLLLFTSIFFNIVQAQKIASEHATKELELLVEALKKSHANPFLHIGKQKLMEEARKLKLSWQQRDSLSTNFYTLDLMRFTALFGDAHLQVIWQENSLHGDKDTPKLFPYLLEMDEAQQAFLLEEGNKRGEQVQAINGHHAAELYQEALQMQAGTAAFVNHYTQRFFFPVFLHLKGIYPPFKLTLANGQLLQPEKLQSFQQAANRLMPVIEPYQFEIIEGNIGYLQYNLCEDYKAFDAFLKNTFAEIEQEHIEKLIIDIRHNMGGNSALNDLLIPYISQKHYRQSSGRHWKVSQAMKGQMGRPLYKQALSKKFIKQYRNAENGSELIEDEYPLTQPKKVKHFYEGELFVLIGPQTFSSANFLADALKTYKLATLVGQPTGELTNDFGETITFRLPHTGMGFTCSVAYDIGANGNPESVSVVQPDIMVEGDAFEYVMKMWRK